MFGQVSPFPGAERDPLAGLRDTLDNVRPAADFELLQRAYAVAADCHQGQYRYSGDPYISHPVMVATILAELGADDQTLCAALLHDTVEDTPLTLTGLRRKFGGGVAAMVADHMLLKHPGEWRGLKITKALAAYGSAAKQLRTAREVLDVFAPAAEELRMPTVGTELQNLAFTTLIRNQPARLPTHRTIAAADIERSTRRLDPVKAELRIILYELFDAALRAAGIHPRHRDEFEDRGDGLLALIHPVEQASAALLFSRMVPKLTQLLTSYNASLPAGAQEQHRLRVRVVVHAGEVNYDGHGCFGEALDTAFRLLDAPVAKKALVNGTGPLLLVVSEDIYRTVVRHGHDGLDLGPGQRRLTVDVGGRRRSGRVFLPL